MGYLVAILAALLLGFVAGLVTLKRSSHWCPACGAVVRCTECAGQPTRFEAARRVERRQASRHAEAGVDGLRWGDGDGARG